MFVAGLCGRLMAMTSWSWRSLVQGFEDTILLVVSRAGDDILFSEECLIVLYMNWIRLRLMNNSVVTDCDLGARCMGWFVGRNWFQAHLPGSRLNEHPEFTHHCQALPFLRCCRVEGCIPCHSTHRKGCTIEEDRKF